jgi:AhpD family alkylhydroperoxidase
MSASYKTLTQEISKELSQFRKEVAAPMAGFDAMAKSAMTEGVLSALNKELIATAIAVSARCEGCVGYHVRGLVKLGATREQVNEMLAVAVYMGGGPSLMFAAEVLHAFEEFSQQ